MSVPYNMVLTICYSRINKPGEIRKHAVMKTFNLESIF